MNTIPIETIQKVWDELEDNTEEAVASLIGKLSDEQAVVFVYLMAMGEDFFSEDEQELLFFLGMAIWKCMLEAGGKLDEVSEEVLAGAEEANMDLVMNMEKNDSESMEEHFEEILKDINQGPLFHFVLNQVLMETEEGTINETHFGIMFIYLKVVIECFDYQENS